MAKSKNTLPPAARASAQSGIRVRLFRAHGIVEVVRGAVDSRLDIDQSAICAALEAAARIIDDVAAALEEPPR